jgi:hypothetical protein
MKRGYVNFEILWVMTIFIITGTIFDSCCVR